MLSQIMKKIRSLSSKNQDMNSVSIQYLWPKRMFKGDSMSVAGYLYKIARTTGTSEYEVFCKAAESWPVSDRKIEQDFSAYLFDHRAPYYVTDFIRKNQKHLDELRIPLF